MSYNDTIGYQDSLSQAIGSVKGLTAQQKKSNEHIDKYNNLINGVITPIGDEFLRQAVGVATKGIQSGVALGINKIRKGAKASKNLINSSETDVTKGTGTLMDDTVDVGKDVKQASRSLDRTELEDLGTRGKTFARNLVNRATGETADLSELSEAQIIARNTRRATLASQKSGQILDQTGFSGVEETDLDRPPPAQPAPDDDEDDFQDAPEEPAPSATEAGGEATQSSELAGQTEEIAQDASKAGKTAEDLEKAGKVERDLQKTEEGVEGADGAQGGADIFTDIAAIGIGIGANILEKKLEKKDATPDNTPTFTQPSFAKGISA